MRVLLNDERKTQMLAHVAFRKAKGIIPLFLASMMIGVLVACGGPGGGGSAPQSSGPVTLTFWSWVPNIQSEIDLFEKSHPNIKVKLVNAGQGTPEYTKLRTALKAGSGAPDVVQMEFQYIPTFTLTKSLVDLRPYGAEADKSKFVDWTWKQVTGSGGEIWAYPQDTGPMGM